MENRTVNLVMYKSLKYIFLVFLFTTLQTNCVDKPTDPTKLSLDDFPAPPINVKAAMGDRVVALTWTHPDVANITRFNIYRQDSTNQNFRIVGSTQNLSFSDNNLQNNLEYRYKISAVAVNGLEGSGSAIVSAVPSIYSVLINLGQTFTNSRAVSLSLTAPASTILVMISNDDSLFTNSQWEAFASQKNWILLPDDGERTVFVKFRDAQDRETIGPHFDNIILDTQAVIREIFHNAGNRVLTPADTIHFAMVTDEAGGRASVDLNNVRLGIELFDNGSNGDALPNDGVYEGDFVIPTGPEVESTLVVGNFTDRAGNVAAELNAPSRVTIRRPPRAVELIEVAPVISSSNSLNLFWSRNSDTDFANYRIYRSLIPGVDNTSPLVTIIQNQATVSFTDSTLVPNTTYYYRVFVFDVTGLFTRSNEKSGTTNPRR